MPADGIAPYVTRLLTTTVFTIYYKWLVATMGTAFNNLRHIGAIKNRLIHQNFENDKE